MESLKAIVTPQSLLVLDFRGLGLERWLVLELALSWHHRHTLCLLSSEHWRPYAAQGKHSANPLNEVEPVILDVLESLVDPKIYSADRSKLHILLQNSKGKA
ncbi:hypothetical protein INR49_003562, partial [Caranx melampygus]